MHLKNQKYTPSKLCTFNFKGALSGLRQFMATESPLKMMKSLSFISSEKLFSFSRYLNSCHDFLVVLKNGLIRNIRLVSRFMTSQRG